LAAAATVLSALYLVAYLWAIEAQNGAVGGTSLWFCSPRSAVPVQLPAFWREPRWLSA